MNHVNSPAGRFGDSNGMQTRDCSGACTAGYYCEEGETRPAPSGKQCKAGRYGERGQNNEICSGQCESGHRCPQGSSSPRQEPCSDDPTNFCPVGSSEPIVVDSGYYTLPMSGNTRSEQRLCPRGSYCVGGVLNACHAGHYGIEDALTTGNCSGACEKGFRCPEGSVSSTQTACGEEEEYPASVFCPEGSKEKHRVKTNYYSLPEHHPTDQRYYQKPCPTAYTCQNGTRYRLLEYLPSASNLSVSGTKFCEIENNETSFTGGQAVVLESDHGDKPFTRIAIQTRTGGDTPSFSLRQQLDPDGFEPGGQCNLTTPFTTTSNKGNESDIYDVKISISPRQQVDFINCPQFLVTLVASADTGRTPAVECQFVVQLTGQNSPPQFSKQSYHRKISELASVNYPVGDPVVAKNRQKKQNVRYSIIDEDGDEPELFNVVNCSGQIYVAKAQLNFIKKGSHILQLQATDDGIPPLNGTTMVYVQVIEEPQPPFFVHDDYAFTIVESATVGKEVDGKLAADDPNQNDTISFSVELIKGDGGTNPFSIRSDSDNSEGILFFDREGEPLDAGHVSQYWLKVTITDGKFEVSVSPVKVDVVDS